MDWNQLLPGLVTALGVGLLIGVIRERRHDPGTAKAGTRTHALVGVLGYVAASLGTTVFIAALLIVGSLATAGYLKTAGKDPGLTGEVALVVNLSLAALALHNAPLAAALGVLCAILLEAKQRLHRVSRDLISQQELQDALMLAAAALVVMPLLPAEPVDPWGVLRLTTVWRIVVLVMAVGMLGHIAMRAAGARWGLAIAGFFSGFASSTAAVASFGRHAKHDAALSVPAAGAALLANLASLLLFAAVIGAVSPAMLRSMKVPLTGAACALAVASVFCLRPGHARLAPDRPEAHSFRLSHALMIAALIAAVSVVAAWLGEVAGDAGVLVAATLVGLVELQAAGASVAQLLAAGGLNPELARWGAVAVLASSAVAKAVLAFVSGGGSYGRVVAIGLAAMIGGALIGMFA
ncbi:MgtC/SapB family protein [Massilia sp. RP-1-19]|uniref:MgtC/SapB family protein n=1 Tax=Massilia polaris TaxID=2728846 RepID=A0A848HN18_9BURK|nr:MgtC/SapB family protein [Massilia polaris]